MRKWMIASVLAFAGLLSTSQRAAAWDYGWPWVRTYYTPAAFPILNPAGYYSNSYYFAWYMPWYAQYNYSHGYYANWWQWGGGYATYGGPGASRVVPQPPKKAAPAKVAIALPADAKLLFNGAVAGGTGESRSFVTPDLSPDQDYAYDLTAEVVRDGQVMTATERVIVRAGEETTVTLKPTATVRK